MVVYIFVMGKKPIPNLCAPQNQLFFSYSRVSNVASFAAASINISGHIESCKDVVRQLQIAELLKLSDGCVRIR